LPSNAHGGKRFLWARLNAYGLLLVGLLMMTVFDLLRPETSAIARVLGQVPVLHPLWTIGYFVAGGMLLWGLFASRVFPEVFGLAVLSAALTVQTVFVLSTFNWSSPEGERSVTSWILIVAVVALRTSALLSKEGIRVTIPGVDGDRS
jgi:hypothetical protein